MKFVLWLVAWGNIIAGIWAVFDKLDKALQDERRESAKRLLLFLTFRSRSIINWPTILGFALDGFFGRKYLSWRGFFKSCILSLVAVAILTIIWLATKFNPRELEAMGSNLSKEYLTFIIVPIFYNLLPDYISLIKTRYIIRLFGRSYEESASKNFTIFILDLITTFLIAAVSYLLFWFLFLENTERSQRMHVINNRTGQIVGDYTLVYHYNALSSIGSIVRFSAMLGIYFYSTFCASFIVWLFASAYFFYVKAKYSGLGIPLINRITNTEEPVASLSIIAMLLATLVLLLAALIDYF